MTQKQYFETYYAEAIDALLAEKDAKISQYQSLIISLEGEIARLKGAPAESKAAFKNFHRALCERFDYHHDEIDWERDQCSLIEWIAKRAAIEVKA